MVPELVKRGVRPDMVTDQTSAHDPLHGYLPKGWSRTGIHLVWQLHLLIHVPPC
ncbi:hypothetical protein, partial [Klebsiella pneumoniae]|uniref:hypothetical protein n=1 Tax=Klebsiella pneumoniae TaxID=573 RepID=UPI003F7ABA2E